MVDHNRFIEPFISNFVHGPDVSAEAIDRVEDVVEDGDIKVRLLMTGSDALLVEGFKGKGTIDPMHVHEDHESIVYLLKGRMRLIIDGQEFEAVQGDVWRHPRGVPHFSEALEDCVQLELKSPPRKTWSTVSE